MGQEVRGVPEAASLATGRAAPSIGRYLARERALRGISLDELAARTKLPRRNLERLERGALDDAADGFVRGWVRIVAEALGLDVDDALMRLRSEPEAPEGDRAAEPGPRVRPAWWIAAAVLLLVLASLSWLRFEGASAPPAGEAAEPEPVYRRDAVRELLESREDAGPR